MTLLIVDDEKQIRMGLSETIDWSQYGINKVMTSENGLKAIEIFKKQNIDILITDIRMPGITGIELIEKAKEFFPDVKTVLLTGYAEFDYAKKAIQIGVDEYLLKPVKINELVDIVTKLCTEIKKKNDRESSKAGLISNMDNKIVDDEKCRWYVEKCKEYLNQNFSRDISLIDLSEYVQKNPCYISHVFKKETGKSFSEYLNSIRIKKAIELITRSSMLVYEVAENVGFNDYRHFTYVFKKFTGKSPSEYKNSKNSLQK